MAASAGAPRHNSSRSGLRTAAPAPRPIGYGSQPTTALGRARPCAPISRGHANDDLTRHRVRWRLGSNEGNSRTGHALKKQKAHSQSSGISEECGRLKHKIRPLTREETGPAHRGIVLHWQRWSLRPAPPLEPELRRTRTALPNISLSSLRPRSLQGAGGACGGRGAPRQLGGGDRVASSGHHNPRFALLSNFSRRKAARQCDSLQESGVSTGHTPVVIAASLTPTSSTAGAYSEPCHFHAFFNGGSARSAEVLTAHTPGECYEDEPPRNCPRI